MSLSLLAGRHLMYASRCVAVAAHYHYISYYPENTLYSPSQPTIKQTL